MKKIFQNNKVKTVAVIAAIFGLMSPALAEAHSWKNDHDRDHKRDRNWHDNGWHGNNWRHNNYRGHDRTSFSFSFFSGYPERRYVIKKRYHRPINNITIIDNGFLNYAFSDDSPAATNVVWDDASTSSYVINPGIKYVDNSSGQYCREFQSQVTVGNEVQESYGTACMQPDGAWKIIQ